MIHHNLVFTLGLKVILSVGVASGWGIDSEQITGQVLGRQVMMYWVPAPAHMRRSRSDLHGHVLIYSTPDPPVPLLIKMLLHFPSHSSS